MSTNETFITEIQNFAYIILKYTEDNDIQDILILPFKSFTVNIFPTCPICLVSIKITKEESAFASENYNLVTILSQKSSEALVGVNLEYTQNMDLVDDQSKYQSIIHVQTTTSIVDTSNSISMD
ncbi:hypothetical protein RIR_jg20868.t1 [Rhizophagus irregularis DAOM 181602=DAOM 197198]|nr:hypothetical protein RIR_jg20868.t1 [Rhizophagus irregularis DAOM 181602=DAOM 197198]CAG8536770.1 4367_t:CDS:2 [Rhizophagus irregularis]